MCACHFKFFNKKPFAVIAVGEKEREKRNGARIMSIIALMCGASIADRFYQCTSYSEVAATLAVGRATMVVTR